MEAFDIQNLSFAYPGQSDNAIDGLSLTVKQGEFLVLCGPSGCGKSTLLRQLKPALTPHGTRSGAILFEGQRLETLDFRSQSQHIGFVQQSPDSQIVTDKVWHELSFGLESLGLDSQTIRRRVAEMASFFGIQDWFHREVAQLSGGQKQLLNLAVVMVMQPSVLLLDEPTAQLDPIAAADFLAALGKLNRELGTTILLTEHRLEDALPLAHTVAVLDGGRLVCKGTPAQVGQILKERCHPMFLSMPTPMRIWGAVNSPAPCPLTVGEGRDWLGDFARTYPLSPLPDEVIPPHQGQTAISARQLWFRYEKDGPDVVKGLSLELHRGEFLTLLGGNGTGKSTSLKLLSGLLPPLRGELEVKGSLGVLPQDPQTLFVKNTVLEDLQELSTAPQALSRVTRLCRLERLLNRHPYDLSGGEQQRAALAKVLLPGPDILLLDEPTKGLDAQFKVELAAILQQLLRQGTAILMVSHDVEFCARYAHRCALFFDGGIVTQAPPREFFSGNRFYTTAANRMARDVLPQAVTAEDVMTACGAPPPPTVVEEPAPLPRLEKPAPVPITPTQKRRTSAALFLLLLIPLTLLLWERHLGLENYYALSLLVLLEGMLPFFLAFEGRRPQARELVVIASLCAMGVAGRAFFFMLPQFKPVMALTIIAGVALGGETGFIVGAMTMLCSNMLFSQGPWTPWQMFAMGIIGALAGLLFHRKPPNRATLCVFGALSAVLIYGVLMNLSSALLWAGELNWGILLTYLATGLPMDCVHAAATVVFLWVAARPMLEKLTRIKVKYGLVE